MSDISSARKAIEEKRYGDALQVCSSLIENGQQTTEVYKIAAQALLFSMTSPDDDDRKNLFYRSLEMAANTAQTVEEICDLQAGMDSAYYSWHEERVREALRIIENNPSIDLWRAYAQQNFEHVKFHIFFSAVIRGSENCKRIKAENRSFDEILEKHSEATVNPFPDGAKKTLEYETGLRIFRAAQEYLENNNDLNALAIQDMVRTVLLKLSVAELIIGTSIPEENDTVIVERLKAQAECLSYMLNAVIYPNGQPMSLVNGNSRSNDIEKLKGLYSKIQSIELDFCVPDLPSAEGIHIPQQSSGGCYVATAIYGSYDCPEVWTLRRYRDNILAETWYGRAFIRTYYVVSPILVKWFGRKKWFKNIWKPKLDRMVKHLNETGMADTPYKDKEW